MSKKNMELIIDRKNLEELIRYSGRSLCGKIFKRQEIFEDKEVLKKAVKEIIWEELRTLRNLLIANGSKEIVVFETSKQTFKNWNKV